VAKQGRLNRNKRKWICAEPALRANLRLRRGMALRNSGTLNGPWGNPFDPAMASLKSVITDRNAALYDFYTGTV
jgi:hypothetical protein